MDEFWATLRRLAGNRFDEIKSMLDEPNPIIAGPTSYHNDIVIKYHNPDSDKQLMYRGDGTASYRCPRYWPDPWDMSLHFAILDASDRYIAKMSQIVVHFANVGSAAVELPDGTAIYPRLETKYRPIPDDEYCFNGIDDFTITGDIFIPTPKPLSKYDCTYIYGSWFTDAKDAIVHRPGGIGSAAIYYNNGNCSYYYPM